MEGDNTLKLSFEVCKALTNDVLYSILIRRFYNCKTICFPTQCVFLESSKFFHDFGTLLIIPSIPPEGIVISFACLFPLWEEDISKLLTIKEQKPQDFLEHFSSLQSCCVLVKDLVLPSVLIKLTIMCTNNVEM